MAKLEPTSSGYYLWKFLPSIAASVVFLILFLIPTIAFLWRTIKLKATFCIPMVIGLLFEVIGYAARAAATNNTSSIIIYAIQSVFILLGPALFAASIYMTLKRVILSIDGAHLSYIPVNWLTRIFVAGDVISFFVQAGGSGLMVQESNANTGKNVAVGGLIIQVIMFGIFAVTAGLFHKRVKREPTPASRSENAWERTMHMLYASSVLIMIRSIFRVVEFAMGMDGYLLSNEWTLFVFDSVPMFLVVVFFWVWFPKDLRKKREPSDIEM